MRELHIQRLKDLLAAVERRISNLPPGTARDKEMEHRAEIKADIQMILWATANDLKPPSK